MNIFELISKVLPIAAELQKQFQGITKRRAKRRDLDGTVRAINEQLDGATTEGESDAPPSQPRELPRVAGVVATTWLNASDDRSGATAEQPAYQWAPRTAPGIGRVLFGAAVPMAVNEGDRLRIRRRPAEGADPGPWYLAPIIEKGPHHITDDYLLTGARPAAESEDGNRAGVDCTPALMAKLLGVSTEEAFNGELSTIVEVQLVRAQPDSREAPEADDAARAVEAARSLPAPFPYAKETNAGELGCAQVISTALVNARLLRRVTLAVVQLRKDLEAAGWRKVRTGAPLLPADVVIWGPTATGTHKHVGLVTAGSPGPVVLHNSSAERRVVERPMTTVARPVEAVLRMPAVTGQPPA